MLKRDRFFAVSARDGSMNPGEFMGDGLWDGDTRILSGLRVLVDGVEPRPTGLQADDAVATFQAAAGSLLITRTRFVERGLHERITITNATEAVLDAVLEVEVKSDFAAMLGIRGAISELAHPATVAPMPTLDGVRFTRDQRSTRVVSFPPGLKHQVRLRPGEEFSLRIDAVPESQGGAPGSGYAGPAASRGDSPPQIDAPVVDFVAGVDETRALYESWADECMAIRTDNSTLNELLEQATADIRMLMNRYDTGIYPTGGLPWFAVPFGRDTLISSMLLLPFNPEIARGVLRFQAAHQGKELDESTQEEPGKILHEVRDGEVVERGFWPHILYTTVDATALFLCTLTETEHWTHDHKFADSMWPAAEAALDWCRRYGDIDGDGYIEDRGIRYRNAVWKDSGDSLTNVDGSDVLRPSVPCEVQAYLHRGLVGMSRRRPGLKEQAASLKWRFNRDFWMPKEKYFAQALDGSKRQVRAITSNPGHCLWMRIVDRPKAAHVAKRLLSQELFSGWGIRTLSDRAINYDACSYHNGSIWPFDTTLAIVGLRQYGFAEEAERVARALIEASIDFPLHRPPELFCGEVREPDAPPREYWNTCTPQLWSAAAMFACVSSILGLAADPRRKVLRITPVRTALWNRIEVTGMHFAGQRVDFTIEGTEVRASGVQGGIRVA